MHVTRRLAEAAVRSGARRIVFASSVKVYGERNRPGRPFHAGDPASPQDIYAQTKAEAENILHEICSAAGIETVVLRLPLVYGPGVKGNFRTLLDAIAARRRLPLAQIDNRRSLLYVGNAVSALETSIAAPPLAGKTLPVADARPVSTSELVAGIAAALGVRPRTYAVPRALLRAGATLSGRGAAAGRLLGSLEVDGVGFCEIAGWSPPFTLAAGLEATAAWYRAASRL
jgi:nucleoside-diphosphate-sugar epimerase